MQSWSRIPVCAPSVAASDDEDMRDSRQWTIMSLLRLADDHIPTEFDWKRTYSAQRNDCTYSAEHIIKDFLAAMKIPSDSTSQYELAQNLISKEKLTRIRSYLTSDLIIELQNALHQLGVRWELLQPSQETWKKHRLEAELFHCEFFFAFARQVYPRIYPDFWYFYFNVGSAEELRHLMLYLVRNGADRIKEDIRKRQTSSDTDGYAIYYRDEFDFVNNNDQY
jgi:hypothetical protein